AQAAIDAAREKDMVVVSPGIYQENIHFLGYNIVLTSKYPEDKVFVTETVIEGDGTSSVVTFTGFETGECILTGFTITGGYAITGGGIFGMYTHAKIEHCIIEGNSATVAGGGVQSCLGGISNSILRNNDGGASGGAIDDSSGPIVNCLIHNNTARYGAALNIFSGDIINCTVTSNTSEFREVITNSDGRVFNSIFWGNSPAGSSDGTVVFNYCCLEWSDQSIGNIIANPKFISSFDFYLSPDSPCIDAGDNTNVPQFIADDLDGNPRFVDEPGTSDTGKGNAPIVDMGAYEYQNVSRLVVSHTSLEITAYQSEPNPDPQTIFLTNVGQSEPIFWNINEDCSWLDIEPAAGATHLMPDEIIIKVNSSNLNLGTYTDRFTITTPDIFNSATTVIVTLTVRGIARVPEEFPTIQSAIDAVSPGDVVLVADNIYTGQGNRNINFKGKAITVRSENGPENCIIDCQGEARGFIFNNGEGNDSVLDGFTIINGFNAEFSKGGGGIYCESTPAINNCILTQNTCYAGSFYGGGIHYHQIGDTTDRLLISNCVFSNNRAGNGGGIWLRNGEAIIENCLICGNHSSDTGGGIAILANDTKIINCTICNNFASDRGGGIYAREMAILSVTNNIIRNNYAFKGTQLALRYNTWTSASYNNIQSGLAGIYIDYSHSNLSWGAGNIDLDPLFADPGHWDNKGTTNPDDDVWLMGDYHLLRGSPCIDAGCDEGLYIDLEGNIRPWDYPGVDNNSDEPEFDMGVYEFTNQKPIAQAGSDQTLYADPNGLVYITLDASGSYDPDSDAELTYKWRWNIAGQIYNASGGDGVINMQDYAKLLQQNSEKTDLNVLAKFTKSWLVTADQANFQPLYDLSPNSPFINIYLSVGKYIVNLTVNDGIEDSDKDQVMITVLATGDLDQDGDIDIDDLSVILAARNEPASGPDDPRDLDKDGIITVLDARILVALFSQ
ncbi:MAG: hypothetical protein GY869_05825, partial [Planctomycetes bacterium]|nr:hypothetical protein [Planctomycetota bacterium]